MADILESKLVASAFPDGIPPFLQALTNDAAFSNLLSEYIDLATYRSIGKSNEHYRRTKLEQLSDQIFRAGMKHIEKECEQLPTGKWEGTFKLRSMQLYRFTACLNKVRLISTERRRQANPAQALKSA